MSPHHDYRDALAAIKKVMVADHVVIRRNPRAVKTATYRLQDISKIFSTARRSGQRDLPAGEHSTRAYLMADEYYIAGYVWCDKMIAGSLDHSCKHGDPGGPHLIKIAILQKDNTPEVWRVVQEAMAWREHRSAMRHDNSNLPQKEARHA
jgi:hypothetical protein